MDNTIVCYRMNCKYNERHRCSKITVVIDEEGCFHFDEIDIYKEAEGFSRDD